MPTAYLIQDGTIVNIVVEDAATPIPTDTMGLYEVVRGIDANIGDSYVNGVVTPAAIPEREPDPLIAWSRALDGAKSISAIKEVMRSHPLLGYTEDAQTNEVI